MDRNCFSERFGDAWPQMLKFAKLYGILMIGYYIVFYLSGIVSETTLYYGYADRMVHGEMPYSDFDAEYPPLSLLLLLIPRLLSFNELSYQIVFGVMAYLSLIAATYFVYRIAEMYTNRPSRYTDVFLIFCVLFVDFILDRYDVFPMVLSLGAVYFFLTNRRPAAWVLLAMGTMIKLYPALLAPVFLIHLLYRREYTEAAKGVGICLVIGILCMLPFVIADPDTALMFITYHADRGMQVESVVSSFIMFLSLFGLTDITYYFGSGSDNIAGALPDACADVMLPLMALALIAAYAVYAYTLKRYRERGETDVMPPLIMTCFAVIFIFMTVNKVLSSQYFIWIIPFVVFMMMFIPSGVKTQIMTLFISILLMTQLNMVVNYAFRAAGEAFGTAGVLVVFLRNILVMVFMVILIRMGYEQLRKVPEGQ